MEVFFVWYYMNMNKPSIQQLTQALHSSWGADTCFNSNKWTEDNAARGQCTVSSLVVQDYFGGELLRYQVNEGDLNEKHYCNILDDGTIIDTTGSQYKNPVNLRVKPVDLVGKFTSVRNRCLSDEDTRQRYELLKSRVVLALNNTKTDGNIL